MSITTTRAVLAGLQQADISIPAGIEESVDAVQTMLQTRSQLAALIRPAVPLGFAPEVQAARDQTIAQLAEAMSTGTYDAEMVLTAADHVGIAESTTARIERAISLLDFATNSITSQPSAPPAAEMMLVDAADDIFMEMHSAVLRMADEGQQHVAELGGSLPSGPAWAVTASKKAIGSYAALQAAAARYLTLRVTQRAFLTLIFHGQGDYESLNKFWAFAEVATGLNLQQQEVPILKNWTLLEPADEFREVHDPTLPVGDIEKALTRFVYHAGRHRDSLWVPTLGELETAYQRAMHIKHDGMADYVTGFKAFA